VRSSGDGTVTHLQNWLDCIRSRKQPNAHIRVAHQAARTSHIANAALKAGHAVRWNPGSEKIETVAAAPARLESSANTAG
jgi:D-hexose-6-phosphate mutarotase